MAPSREETRRLAQESIARGDPVGWFEELYRRASGSWDRVPWADLTPNPHLLEWLASSGAGAGRSCLVVGCGLGDDAEALAAAGFRVVAFDISATAIEACRARFPASQVQYAVADLLSPPPAWTSRFELVFESYTLQVLPPAARLAAALALASLVAPRGRLLLICRAREPEEPEGQLPWPLTRRELAPLTERGLRELAFEDFLDRETPPVRRFRVLLARTDRPDVRAGGCLCGAIRYRFSGDPLTLYACHCTDCQVSTGSAFVLSMPVPRESIELLHGTPEFVETVLPDGRPKRSFRCPRCATHLWGAPIRAPQVLNLHPTTLDDTSWLDPVGHIWTRSALPWVVIPQGALSYPRQPEDFLELVRAWKSRPARPAGA
jgi:SAM-dependent methyltransferase